MSKTQSSTWFITGINRGLGRSIAEEVMRRGGRVAGTVRNLAHADELQKQFPDQLWIGKLDLTDLANTGASTSCFSAKNWQRRIPYSYWTALTKRPIRRDARGSWR